MIRFSPRDLSDSMTDETSNQDGPLERARRELEELRDRVRKAELAAAKFIRPRGQPPLPRR